MALDVLGPAVPSAATLTGVVRSVVGDSGAEVVSASAAVVDYVSSSPATGGLHRVEGTARRADGSMVDWSVFVKTLRHVRLSPMMAMLPPGLAQTFADEFPWRFELDAYLSEAQLMPPGLRTPVLHAVVEADAWHCIVWMEDVCQHPAAWDADRYTRSAHGLGRLAARRAIGRSPEPSRWPVGYALRMYVGGRVKLGALPLLRDEAVWGSPLLASADRRLRQDLLALAARIDPWLDCLDTLPQTLAHGDASPQNLLVPMADPETFVVIDWGFGSPLAVGFDLGQLLVGLVQAGEADAADLAQVHEAILAAYVEGLAVEGMVVDQDVVRFGYVASLVIRSAFSALMPERLGEPDTPQLREAFRQRVLLTRFIVDLGLAEPHRGPLHCGTDSSAV